MNDSKITMKDTWKTLDRGLFDIELLSISDVSSDDLLDKELIRIKSLNSQKSNETNSYKSSGEVLHSFLNLYDKEITKLKNSFSISKEITVVPHKLNKTQHKYKLENDESDKIQIRRLSLDIYGSFLKPRVNGLYSNNSETRKKAEEQQIEKQKSELHKSFCDNMAEIAVCVGELSSKKTSLADSYDSEADGKITFYNYINFISKKKTVSKTSSYISKDIFNLTQRDKSLLKHVNDICDDLNITNDKYNLKESELKKIVDELKKRYPNCNYKSMTTIKLATKLAEIYSCKNYVSIDQPINGTDDSEATIREVIPDDNSDFSQNFEDNMELLKNIFFKIKEIPGEDESKKIFYSYMFFYYIYGIMKENQNDNEGNEVRTLKEIYSLYESEINENYENLKNFDTGADSDMLDSIINLFKINCQNNKKTKKGDLPGIVGKKQPIEVERIIRKLIRKANLEG